MEIYTPGIKEIAYECAGFAQDNFDREDSEGWQLRPDA
jgi:hypothetical protein